MWVAYFSASKHAKIIKADVDTRGTQLKLLLTLKGNQQVIFKPKWYPIEQIIEGPVYAGKDRFGSEILLKAKISSIKKEIIPVATKRLLDTIFEKN
ncbi:hypothetical protein NQ317_008435 [Molorchus minor]|uniref:Uncharacterized protein n=1 Tax=Molorchus minor TaxID=1323400 RepID=A0ABQ9JEG9_9CUCU|nr:hypothetical protein NQ317_008435 [Molorchus minor]